MKGFTSGLGQRGLIALLLVMALAGCGSPAKNGGEPFGGDKNPNASSNAALAEAPEQVQALYKQTCLSCHGNNLEGKVGPTTNLQKIGSKLSKDQIAKQITNGGNGMPGFGSKLKPEEVDALAAWLAAKK
ncbi:cytochrome C [Paenibacillus rigui]|uniref:Cytochrome C n=2 Tax=Paenibacillus rigui TaxID=554312 RepID=A0A229UNP7_9BACL|nr:cytochrome C [Paenibacillus rigui]